MMPQSTPNEALLTEQNATLRVENEALKQEVEQLKQDVKVLRLKLDAMARKLFGKSSEKLDAAQLQMVFDALEKELQSEDGASAAEVDGALATSDEPTPKTSQGTRKKRSLEDLIERLPVNETIIDPDEVKEHPEDWDCIGSEVTKLIDYTPGKFICQHIVRRKYVRKDARHLPPIIAPLLTLQERSIAAPALLAHTATQRFEYHMPYYRIESMYERAGVPISRQTLCGWMGMCHEAVSPIMALLLRDVFADGYVMIDALSGAK